MAYIFKPSIEKALEVYYKDTPQPENDPAAFAQYYSTAEFLKMLTEAKGREILFVNSDTDLDRVTWSYK